MTPFIQNLISVAVTLIASGGFWTWLQTKTNRDDALIRIVQGIGHELVVERGMIYIERGWITEHEYQDFEKYIYQPYHDLGGNGLAEKIYLEVKELPFRSEAFKQEFERTERLRKDIGREEVSSKEDKLNMEINHGRESH